MRKIIRLSAMTTAMLIIPANVLAQDIGDTTAIIVAPQLHRDDVAGTRLEPGLSPQAHRSGPLSVAASVSISGGFDSNVLNRGSESIDAMALITPRLRVRSETGLGTFEVAGIAHLRRFADKDGEDSNEYAVRGLAEVNLGAGTSVFADLAYTNAIEARSTFGSASGADEPVQFDNIAAEVGAQFEFGPLWLRPSTHLEFSDFSSLSVSGAVTDQSFRNMVRAGAELEAGIELFGGFTTFAEARFSKNDSPDAAVTAVRDGDEQTVMAGVRGEITPLFWAEIAVGLRKADFDLARFDDTDGLTYRADIQWFVTELVTFRLEASQSHLNSGTVQVGGILSNRASLTGYFDTLPKLRLSIGFDYERNQFREVDAVATRVSTRLTAQYQLNRFLAVGGFVGIRRQVLSETLFLPEYTSVSTGIGVTFTP